MFATNISILFTVNIVPYRTLEGQDSVPDTSLIWNLSADNPRAHSNSYLVDTVCYFPRRKLAEA